jgi:copper transport protein
MARAHGTHVARASRRRSAASGRGLARAARGALAGAARGTVAALAALAALLLLSEQAAAHAELQGTEPSSGQQLRTAPERLVLHFTEPVELRQAQVRVLSSSGRTVTGGRPDPVAGDPRAASLDLPALDDGGYVVSWRIVSADTHPIQGAFTFRVGAAAGGRGQPLPAVAAVQASQGDPLVGALLLAFRVVATAGLLTLVGGAAFLSFTRRPRTDTRFDQRLQRRTHDLLCSAWILGFGGTMGSILLQGPYATGRPVGAALDPELIGQTLSTRFGEVLVARALLLLLAVPLLRASSPDRAAPLSWEEQFGAILLVAGVILTPGLIGHASTGADSGYARTLIGLHFGAVAVWFGGLVLLVASVLPGRPARLREAVPTFSSAAFAAMVVIVLTGARLAWREVDSARALVSTPYGRLLLAKLAAFVLLIALASVSREWVRHKLLPAAAVSFRPAGPGAALADSLPASQRALRRFVLAEVAVAIVILAVTGALSSTAPAREQATTAAAAPPSNPVRATLRTPRHQVRLQVDPGRVGANSWRFEVLSRAGAPATVQSLRATLTKADQRLGPLPIQVRRTGPNVYAATAETPIQGAWKLEIRLLVSEFDETRATTTVQLT